ncbi:heme-binding domain-containing protein [soil metagenome]
MKKALKIIAIVIVLGFIVIQFIRPDFTNPPVNQAETMQASMQVPDNVQAILKRSCTDCHSNETVYPWYSKIQPSAWFLANHIKEGRQEMNFSVWNTYQPRRKKKKLETICEQIKAKEMPLPSYLWIHRDAALTDEDIKTVCDWTENEGARLESVQ